MESIYLVCAILGGTLFLGQFLLSLIGHGGHHDMGHVDAHDGHVGHGGDHGDHSAVFLHVFSFRAIVAAITIFGLSGIAAERSALSPLVAVAIAIGGGLAAMFLVGSLLGFLSSLKADGTVRIEQALHQPATVYLTIPARNAGQGKVTVTVQERTMEYLAVTSEDSLPTGSKVLVVDIVSPDTVRVERAAEASLT